MPLLLVLLFVAVPIAELYVIIQIGQAIGALPTIALLILASVLGAALMRSQGRAGWRRFNAATAEGRVPGREVIDGALIILGGALLLTPGFLSDILGLILLLPPTRAIVRGMLARRFAGHLLASASRGAEARMGRIFSFPAGPRGRTRGSASRPRGPAGGRGDPARPPRTDDDVIDAEATEVEPRRPRLP